MFIYAGTVDPLSTIPNQTYEGEFNNDMKYLSPCSRTFVLNYFSKCNWQGWGLGWYEQGPREIIELQYQDPTNKRGLGYRNKCKNLVKSKNVEEEASDYNENILEEKFIIQENSDIRKK